VGVFGVIYETAEGGDDEPLVNTSASISDVKVGKEGAGDDVGAEEKVLYSCKTRASVAGSWGCCERSRWSGASASQGNIVSGNRTEG